MSPVIKNMAGKCTLLRESSTSSYGRASDFGLSAVDFCPVALYRDDLELLTGQLNHITNITLEWH